MHVSDAGNGNKQIVSKIFSGRYLMTVTACVVFAYMAVKGLLTQEYVSDVIKLVFMFYFLKKTGEK